MQTSKWGPYLWKSIHAIAHNYDPNNHDPDDYRNFFENLGKVLPCKYCRQSYQEFFAELPIDDYLDSQKNMAYWMYLMHNKVNEKLRKQGLLETPDPSFASVYQKYDQWKADCTKKRGKPTTCRIPDSNDRCCAQTKKGRQCSRYQTAKGGKCTQHAECPLQTRRKMPSRRTSRRTSRRMSSRRRRKN